NGQAVKAACETLRERLAPIAAELVGAESATALPASAIVFERGFAKAPQVPGVAIPFERVVDRAYMKQVPLSATGCYRTPGIGDAPASFHVTLLPNAAQSGVIHGSKAVGEPPLMLAISVREAIRDAIAAFGAPGGEIALASPATHEAILAAITTRLTSQSSS